MKKVMIIALILVGALLIPAVSATYEQTLNEQKYISIDYNIEFTNNVRSHDYDKFYLSFYNIEAYADVATVYVRTTTWPTAHSNLSLLQQYDSRPQNVQFTESESGKNIGYGTITYNIFYDSNNLPTSIQFWVDFYEWDVTGLSGNKLVRVNLEADSPLRQYSFAHDIDVYDPISADKPVRIGSYKSGHGFTGYYVVKNKYVWSNIIRINDDELSLIRNNNYSILKIESGENVFWEESYDDRHIRIFPPITWTVTNSIGTSFTGTYAGDDPEDPGDPGGFALALSRSSAQIGETLTATLTAQDDAPHYSYLVWSCTPDDHPDMATWSYRIQDENGTWYERAANGDEIPISAADALTYQATPAYPGGHHIGVTIYDHHPPCQGLEQRATLAKPFEALYKSGSSPVRIQVVDERTGALIAGSNIQVIDSQLPPFEGTGINPIIDTTLPQGSEMFYLQRNAYDEPRYRIFADADGYRQVTENQWFSVNPPAPNTVTTVTVQMAATVAPPEDPNNAFVTFRIRDEDGNPVREARVTLDRWTRHALGTRPVTFEVPRGATYQYTVEPIDPGLYPATGSVTVGAEDSYEVNVVLSRTPGDDPGATPPPRDTRTNEEKGKAVIDLIADNAELIATLAILAAVMGLINLIMPGRRRR